MANLQEFNAGDLGLRPSETGVEARQAAGRRIGASFNQVAGELNQLGSQTASSIKDAGASYLQYAEHKDISKLSADFAEKQDQLIKQWNDTAKSADPNDPNVAKKFRDEVLEPQLENFGADAGTEAGEKFAQSHVIALRNHMFEKTAADMSTLSGIAAKVNFEKTVNSLSNTAMSDPSSLDHALEIAESSIKGLAGSAPNLSVADAARVQSEGLLHAKEAIVKSAAMGVIQKTGELPSWINDDKYKGLINGAELKQFQNAAKAQQKANSLVEKQTQLVQKQIAEQNVHAAAGKAMTDNITFDAQTGAPVVDPKFFKDALAIARDNPNAPNAASVAHTMISWGESQQAKGAKPADDPTVKTNLMDRMFSPDNPTSTLDLMKARAEGKISDHTFQAYHGLVQELEQSPLKGPIWQSVTAAAKSTLIKTDLMGDKIGSDLYAGFMQDFLPKYQAMKRAGTLPANALDLNDPKSMISQSIQPYKLSMQDRLKPGVKAAPAAEPAKPETPPMEGARKAKDGNWYVEKDGKFFRVDR